MDRLISEQYLIEHLTACFENGRPMYRPTLDEVLEMIKATPSAELKWTPVSEGLPEKNMECLVAVSEFNLTQKAMYSDLMGTMSFRIFYQGDYGTENFENITYFVNAWMPSPEQYAPQEREE